MVQRNDGNGPGQDRYVDLNDGTGGYLITQRRKGGGANDGYALQSRGDGATFGQWETRDGISQNIGKRLKMSPH